MNSRVKGSNFSLEYSPRKVVQGGVAVESARGKERWRSFKQAESSRRTFDQIGDSNWDQAPSNTVFIDGLKDSTMYYHVEDLFFKIGRVANMYIQRARKRTRKSKFGFVRFFTSAEATKAIQELDGILVNGAAMHLSYARFPLFQDKANCNVVGGNQSGKSFKQIWVHKKKKGVAVPLDSVVRVASREDGKNRVERTLIASSSEDFVSAEQR